MRLRIVGLVCLSLMLPAFASAQGNSGQSSRVEIYDAVRHDLSPPLRNIPPFVPMGPPETEKPVRSLPLQAAPAQQDPVVQTAAITAAPSAGLSFDGLGTGFAGFTVNSAPPDTNGAVGATQFVEWVNESFAVFNKSTGAIVYGPAAGNTLWAGFGGPCQSDNDGDPIAQYDKQAKRWIMTQFAVTGGPPYYQCVAISQTSDATGAWNRYAFQFTAFNDYPKLGVWSDAYYMTFNMFSSATGPFQGAKVCALDRNAMLAGAPATAQCFQLSTSVGGLLPADLDGITAPPAGSPGHFLNFGTNSLNLWHMHVDFATPANTTLSTPVNIPVAAFTAACNGGTCIPQPGTRQKLDSLADRLMYRLAYRNFGSYESLVVNHSVAATVSGTATVGVRWYEIRNLNGTPSVSQQGTFAPDTDYRWMGTIAMDQMGNMALGFSVSSASTFPSIRYTGRLANDIPGTMSGESSLMTGGGSQLQRLSRWGDYSSISVDPVDDCTMWFTTEYLKTSGTFNWSTRIGTIKFASCPPNTPPFGSLDSAVGATTNTSTVPQGTNLVVKGWAADQQDGAPVNHVTVLIDGTSVGNATLGFSRPDVAAYFNNSSYNASGYQLNYNIGTLALGAHSVTAVAYDSAGASTTLGTLQITVGTASANTPPFGSLDSAVGATTNSSTVPQGTNLVVSGWAADQQDGAPVNHVTILIDGSSIGNATLGFSRPDVAAYFGNSAYTNSGYQLTYNIGTLALGTHSVTAVAYDSQGVSTTLGVLQITVQ
jgi:hypothetical protein